MTQSGRRFLLLTLDAAGNWPPELALIRRLVERGHRVTVVSGAQHAAQIDAAGAEYRPYRRAPDRDTATRSADPPEQEMLRVLREVFFNPIYADELLAQVADVGPDVLLVDQMLMAAQAAAETTGLPTAILWHSVYRAMASRRRRARGPLLEPLNALRERLGVPPLDSAMDGADRVDAVLAFTYAEFDSDAFDPPPNLRYVGPLACLPQPQPRYAMPWRADDKRPLVLVSYSTSFQNQVDTLQRVADAVAELPARVLLTLGHAIAADELRLPDNVVAERFVPHAAVLPQARLVVTHAGHGTVMAAVTAGVPLVCTPMGRDQHEVAACVERAGLGAVVPAAAAAEALRDSVATVLADDALRARARAFAARVDVEAGARHAVAALESLNRGSARPSS